MHGGAGEPRGRLGHLDRVLVGGHQLAGHVRPGEALGALARGDGHAGAPLGVERERVQRLGELDRIGRGHEHAVHVGADHVAVARDVGADHRRAGRERLGQHHAEALAARARARTARRPRAGGATSPRRSRGPRISMPLLLEQVGLDLLARGAGTTRRAGTSAPRSASKARSSTGRPLRSSARPDEQQPSSLARGLGLAGRRRRDPRRSARSGSGRRSSARPVQRAASETAMRTCRRLYRRRAPISTAMLFVNAAGSVGVEGPDERRAATTRVASQLAIGDVRLVHVHHVVAAVVKLAAERPPRVRGHRDVRHRAVSGQAERAAERDR